MIFPAKSDHTMGAFVRRSEATFVLFVWSTFLFIPSSPSPHSHSINRPVALLLPNGNIVQSPSSSEYDPHNQKPTLFVPMKPSEGSIRSLLSANFFNKRKKGLAEVQSRVHGITDNGIPFRPYRHLQPKRFRSDCTKLQNSQPQNYGNAFPPSVHYKNAQACYCHCQLQNEDSEVQFSSSLNNPCSSPLADGKKTACTEFNELLISGPQRRHCNTNENVKKTSAFPVGDENVRSGEHRADSLRTTSHLEDLASDPAELQNETLYCCSDTDLKSKRPTWACSRGNGPLRVGQFCHEASNLGNPLSNEAETVTLLFVANKSMFRPHEITQVPADTMPCELLSQCPTPMQTPCRAVLPTTPWRAVCKRCLQMVPPCIPRAPTVPGTTADALWLPRMNSPPWPLPPSWFPRTSRPWTPDWLTPTRTYAYCCSPLGSFVPTGTAATDTSLVYVVVLPDIVSSTSALNFFPLNQLNIVELQEFFDLLLLPLIIATNFD